MQSIAYNKIVLDSAFLLSLILLVCIEAPTWRISFEIFYRRDI